MSDARHPTNAPLPAVPQDGLEPGYRGFFAEFNAGRYFEAHEVLEAVWLPRRGGADARFYQGLIQLAGAFVHLQKQRPAPAVRLFRLAEDNLTRYGETHLSLELGAVRRLITSWLERLEQAAEPGTVWGRQPPPVLPPPPAGLG